MNPRTVRAKYIVDGCIKYVLKDIALLIQGYDFVFEGKSYIIGNHAGNFISDIKILNNKTIISTAGGNNNVIKIWDIESTECINMSYTMNQCEECTGSSLCVLSDGMILMGSWCDYDDHTLCQWDPRTCKKNMELYGHTSGIFCVLEILPGMCASGSSDRTIRIWDLETQKCKYILTGHSHRVCCLALLSDGRIVSGSSDGTIKIWNLNILIDDKCEHTLKSHTNIVNIVILPDDTLISVSFDETIKIWCLKDGKYNVDQTLIGPDGMISGLCTLPDDTIISSNENSGILMWKKNEFGKFEQNYTLISDSSDEEYDCITVLEDGRFVSGSFEGEIRLWY